MAGDFAISQTTPRAALQDAIPSQAQPGFKTPPDAATASTASKRPLINPSLHLDLALNLVVLQFLDDKGDVTDSIPSPKQLKAYQAQQSDGTGPSIPAVKPPRA